MSPLASNTMRVVVINDFSVARGGATGLALLLIGELKKLGIDVTFIAGDGGDAGSAHTDGVQRLNLAMAPLKGGTGLVSGLFNRRARDVLGTWIAEHDTNSTIYHVHGWAQILSPSIFKALEPVAARTVIHLHDYFLFCPNGGLHQFPTNSPCSKKPLSMGCVVSACDKRSQIHKPWRVARSLTLAHVLGDIGLWHALILLHEGMRALMPQSMSMRASTEVLRNPSSTYGPARVAAEHNSEFVFIGRLEAEKGIEDFLSVSGDLGISPIVIGEGSLGARLKRDYPSAQFLGWLERDALSQIMQRARAVVVPSRWREPYGLVIAEAARSGIPVIVSSTALLSREVADFGLGLTFSAGDRAELSAAIDAMRKMPSHELAQMSRAGFDGNGALCLTPREWTERLVGIYRRAIEAERHPATTGVPEELGRIARADQDMKLGISSLAGSRCKT